MQHFLPHFKKIFTDTCNTNPVALIHATELVFSEVLRRSGANFMESVTVNEKSPLTTAEKSALTYGAIAVTVLHGLARKFGLYACIRP